MDSNFLILNQLFRNLSLIDLLKFRSVCKLWKSIIDKVLEENDELILFLDNPLQNTPVWKYNGKRINLKRSLSISHLKLSNENFRSVFKKIKKLLIYSYSPFEENEFNAKSDFIKFLSDNLVHIQLDEKRRHSIFPNNFTTTIEFKRLKTFHSFNHTKTKPDERTLNNLIFHNLEQLSLWNLTININTYQFIKNLKFLSVVRLEFQANFELPNLEIICFSDCTTEFDLGMFPKLKELHYDIYTFSQVNYMQILLDQMAMYEKNDLDLYVKGIKFRNEFRGKKVNYQNPFHSIIDWRSNIKQEYLDYLESFDHLEYESDLECRWSLELTKESINSLENMNLELRKKLLDKITCCHISKDFNITSIGIVFESCDTILFGQSDPFINSLFLSKNYHLNFPNVKCIQHFTRHLTLDFRLINHKSMSLSFLSNFPILREINLYNIMILFEDLKNLISNCHYLNYLSFSNFKNCKISFDKRVYLPHKKKVLEFDSKLSLLDYLEKERILPKRRQLFNDTFCAICDEESLSSRSVNKLIKNVLEQLDLNIDHFEIGEQKLNEKIEDYRNSKTQNVEHNDS